MATRTGTSLNDNGEGDPARNVDSFHQTFFPESRPPSTITSSVHKKYNLVEAIVHQAYAPAQIGLLDRICSWAFEVIVVGLLIILVRKFITRILAEKDVARRDSAPLSERKGSTEEHKGTRKSSPAHDHSSRVEEVLTLKKSETRETMRFKSKDFKFVKKRKWVSTGPTMAHGRDLSLSPDKKLFHLRNHHLFAENNPMLNPLPLLAKEQTAKDAMVGEEEGPTVIQTERSFGGGGVMEIKLHIPVKLTIENIYNLKDSNVMRFRVD